MSERKFPTRPNREINPTSRETNTDDQGIKSAEHGKAPQVSSGRLPRPRALARRLPAAVAGREAIGDLRAKTAIEPAHRRQGEVLVLLGTNFDNPPAIRRFDAGDEHHFFVWPIADVTTFEGCGESDARMKGSGGGIVGGLGSNLGASFPCCIERNEI
jgi:hypothetical protein